MPPNNIFQVVFEVFELVELKYVLKYFEVYQKLLKDLTSCLSVVLQINDCILKYPLIKNVIALFKIVGKQARAELGQAQFQLESGLVRVV